MIKKNILLFFITCLLPLIVSASAFDHLIFKQDIIMSEASGTINANEPDFACDNKTETRWESPHQQDPQWIIFTLHQPKFIEEIIISWEFASAKKYDILLSLDKQRWITAASVTNGDKGEKRRISFKPQKAKYIKILAKERATEWGYSVWEIELNADALEKQQFAIINAFVSSDNRYSNGAEAVFDSDLATQWQPVPDETDPWAVIEFKKISLVSMLSIIWDKVTDRPYTIQYSLNNKQWEFLSLAENKELQKVQNIRFTRAVKAKFLRLLFGKAAGKDFSISQIKGY